MTTNPGSLPTAALLGLASVLFAAPAAHACSCAIGFTEFVAPAQGASGVPSNTRIWVGVANLADALDPASGITLLDSDGEAVGVTHSEITADLDVLAVYTPDAPLAVGPYTVLDTAGSVITSFTVGADSDDEAPASPLEIGREASSDARGPFPTSSCGYADMVTIEVETDGLFVLANVEGADSLDVDAVAGSASQVAFDGTLRIGKAGCTFSWADAEPSATTTVRLGTFDLAGNFSGWTEPDAVTLPPAGATGTGSGCSAAGGASPGAFAFLFALGVLGALRRQD